MSINDGCDIDVSDPSIYHADTSVMDNNNGVVTFPCDIYHKLIRCGICKTGTIITFRGPFIDENYTSTGSAFDIRIL